MVWRQYDFSINQALWTVSSNSRLTCRIDRHTFRDTCMSIDILYVDQHTHATQNQGTSLFLVWCNFTDQSAPKRNYWKKWEKKSYIFIFVPKFSKILRCVTYNKHLKFGYFSLYVGQDTSKHYVYRHIYLNWHTVSWSTYSVYVSRHTVFRSTYYMSIEILYVNRLLCLTVEVLSWLWKLYMINMPLCHKASADIKKST